RPKVERIAEGDAPVVNLDGVDLERPARPAFLSLLHFALDDRRQVPPSIRRTGHDDARTRQPDLVDDDAALHELTNAVAERHVVDRDQRHAGTRQADVAELDAAQQRAPEPA